MREEKKKVGTVKALWSWVLDQAIEHWPQLFLVVLTGGGMTYLAHVTDWVTAYGPLAWGGIGLLSLLVTALVFLFYGMARARLALALYLNNKASITAVNTLAPVHQHERIEFASFFNPFYRSTVEDVRFEHCDLMGPANIALGSSTLNECEFIDCDVIIVRADRKLTGAIFFDRCLFVRSRLYRVTLLMTVETYQHWPEEMRHTLPVISDGRVDVQPSWTPPQGVVRTGRS